jgi:hypothetical protein
VGNGCRELRGHARGAFTGRQERVLVLVEAAGLAQSGIDAESRPDHYMAFMDPGRDGPLVVEIPPASDDHVLNGSLCNIWQVPLEDVGKFGADEGRGGYYLLLPPGWDGQVPDGYIVLESDTNRVYSSTGGRVTTFGALCAS